MVKMLAWSKQLRLQVGTGIGLDSLKRQGICAGLQLSTTCSNKINQIVLAGLPIMMQWLTLSG